MRKIALLGAVMMGGLIACQDDTKTIPLDRMTLIMADLDLLDKMVREMPSSSRDSMSNLLMQNLLKVHKVSYDQLERNLYLYQSDYEVYEELLQQLGDYYDSKI